MPTSGAANSLSSGRLGGVPTEIRTLVTAVKGRCPGPLDDGDVGILGVVFRPGCHGCTPSSTAAGTTGARVIRALLARAQPAAAVRLRPGQQRGASPPQLPETPAHLPPAPGGPRSGPAASEARAGSGRMWTACSPR